MNAKKLGKLHKNWTQNRKICTTFCLKSDDFSKNLFKFCHVVKVSFQNLTRCEYFNLNFDFVRKSLIQNLIVTEKMCFEIMLFKKYKIEKLRFFIV